MDNKKELVVVVLSVIALCLSAVSLSTAMSAKNGEAPAVSKETEESEENKKDVQYVMYIGTNDKDTNEPVYSEEEAKEVVKEVLIDHFGGYTLQEANGGWKDGDTIYQEYSIVATISDTDLDSVHKAADELIEKLNQSSILIQTNETVTEFYSNED